MIHYRNTVRKSGIDARTVKRTAKLLLAAIGEKKSALSISFVDDRTIRELNREHRGKDKPTDVLSFPLLAAGESSLGERLLGDVVISVDTARRQAAGYDATLEAEVNRLLIHGVLHVMGHDHEESAEQERMLAEERRLACAIGLPWPYDN
ncbi:MAG: rRNA maturation RNase YbeY [Candidatus Eremiobacteraeota bacterium]|nr:rRNA maturation RNase YbeY [Candidatus Eremiobacteraeota bacterium]